MKSIDQLKQTPNLCVTGRKTSYGMDRFHVYEGFVDWPGFKGSVIFGYDEARLMEHVSVSCYNRKKLPTWDDMCKLKKMFFNDDEMVVQIHPSSPRHTCRHCLPVVRKAHRSSGIRAGSTGRRCTDARTARSGSERS